ncbi:MAG: Verru/Chthon cassette protein A, partial [Verrucomicrobiota bacterium]
KAPHDHLLLDFFWMPVVEPRPISRPFETEGKVNLNQGILPFTHIERKTALHAVLKNQKLMAIPDTDSRIYKSSNPNRNKYRHFIDPVETLNLLFEEKNKNGDVFISASEICEHYFVPEGESDSKSAMKNFWARHRLTGDNTKERPYAHILPHLTTRSNTYRIHFISESLQPSRSASPGTFVEDRDRVAGRYQGSALIERYIEPKDEELIDLHDLDKGPRLQNRYRYRISTQKTWNG